MIADVLCFMAEWFVFIFILPVAAILIKILNFFGCGGSPDTAIYVMAVSGFIGVFLFFMVIYFVFLMINKKRYAKKVSKQ